jgi:hypothetical protein
MVEQAALLMLNLPIESGNMPEGEQKTVQWFLGELISAKNSVLG